MVSVAYEILFQTCFYADDCVWQENPDTDTDKTWPSFKQFFTAASQDLRQSKNITGSSGYHALPHDAVDITHTLNTITTVLESDQSTITKMTNHNHHLTALSGLGTAIVF